MSRRAMVTAWTGVVAVEMNRMGSFESSLVDKIDGGSG